MSTEDQARAALAHAETLAEAAVTDAANGHEAFRLATELAKDFRLAADRIARHRAGAAMRIRDEEALTLRALADRIGVSRSRADQLVKEAASHE